MNYGKSDVERQISIQGIHMSPFVIIIGREKEVLSYFCHIS